MHTKNGLFPRFLELLARARKKKKGAVDKGSGEASRSPIRQPDIESAIRLLKAQCNVPMKFIRVSLSDGMYVMRLEIHDGADVLYAEFSKDEAGMFLRSVQSNHARMRE